MKKILVMLLFSFSVIAYASPPPDPTPSIIADHVQLVVQAEVQNIQPAVQEVAYVYLGHFELASYQVTAIELEAKLEFPELVMNDDSYCILDDFNKPPANSDFAGWLINKQHTNYGYPLTAN